jgi:hypothetical protein
MLVKQISAFVENAKGRLSEITKILADAGVNIRAMSVADTTDYGVLRMLAPDPQKAYDALHAAGVTARLTDVLVLGLPDEAGGLNRALNVLSDCGVNVEYMYATLGGARDYAYMIIKTDAPEVAAQKLSEAGVTVVGAEEAYTL